MIDCDNPGTPTNGDTMISSTTFGSVATHTCDDGYVLVGSSQRACIENRNWSAPYDGKQCTVTDLMYKVYMHFAGSKMCHIQGQSIYPYSQYPMQTSYLLKESCEHTVLTFCSGSEKLFVNVDYSEESLNLATIGIHYNTTIIIITICDSLIVTAYKLEDVISQSGPTTEYSNQIFVTQIINEIIVDIRCVGVKLAISSLVLQVKVSSSALKGDFCGLCGRLNGELVHSDNTTIADILNDTSIQQFTKSWRAVDMFLHDVAHGKCSKKMY